MFTYFLGGMICVYFCVPESVIGQTTQQAERYIATGPNSNGFIETLPGSYSYDTTKQYPLLIFLAGEGQLGNNLDIMEGNGPPQIVAAGQWPDSFMVNGKSFSFIVISPQFVQWPTDADVDSVVRYALTHYRVDTGRIYMTGLSMGGGAVWSYASAPQHAGMLAAILPISGGQMWSGLAGAQAISQNNLAVFGVSNRWDPQVNDTTLIHNINLINSVVPRCNPVAMDTIYPDSGHDAWTQTYYCGLNMHDGLNCYQWLLQFSRNKDGTRPPTTTPPADSTDSVPTDSVPTKPTPPSDSTPVVTPPTNPNPPPSDSTPVVTPPTDPNPPPSDSTPVVTPPPTNPTPPATPPLTPPVSPPPQDPSILTSFVAMLEPQTPVAKLMWTTTDGETEPYYVVERSYDALEFKSIDTVSASSDSTIINAHSYILTDPHILPGYNYYRLCLVYPDGDTSYSVLQRVSYLPGLSGLRLSPNPTTSQLWLDLSQAPAGTLLVNVLDDQGRTIRKWVFQNQFNYWREAIDVANLAPGSYILQLAGQGTQTSQVFIKQ